MAALERDKTVTRAIHRLFWHVMLKFRGRLATVYVLYLPAFIVFNIYVPLQVAYGIQAIVTRHFDVATHQAMVVIAVTFVAATFYAIGVWFQHRVNVLGGSYLQQLIFANYLNKDYDFYSDRHIGALGADAVAIRSAYQEYEFILTFDALKAAVIIVIGLAVVFYKSVPLGLVTAACILTVTTVSMLIASFRLKYRRALSQANSHLAAMMGDPLSHGPAVKSYAQEEYEQQRLLPALTVWQRAQFKIFDTSIPHNYARHILLAITTAILLLSSANLYKHGSISIAVVAMVQLYVIRIVNTTLEIGEIIKRYESLMSDAYEPVATMLVPASVADPLKPVTLKPAKTYGIKLDGVSFHYPEAATDQLAVNDFTLAVKPGEKVGLIGFSGGGKTTISKLLLRFMDVDKGSIKIDGIDIKSLRQTDLRNVIAYVPQEPLLFHRSIKENIAYARPEAAQKDIEKAAKIAFVDDFVKELPNGYDTMVGERGVKLSGGQRQRVAIARALLKDAPILVLDEATSALDSQSEQYIQKALWELMKDRTAIVIAHRLSTIQHLDRIVVMDKGKIVQIGTHQELLKSKPGIYARLWARQSGGYLADA
jgi:ATP-binding cassette subfamily B protein